MKKDLVLAPIGEAALLAIVGAVGCFSHQPLIFASLGPTAYELIETPHRRSAKPYSILVGHAAAIAAGFIAIYVTGAAHVAPVSSGGVPAPRIWAAAVAALITVFVTLLLRASQPAAISTALLVSLGMMQRPRDAAVIMIAVLLMVLVGEPVRAYRLRHDPEKQKISD